MRETTKLMIKKFMLTKLKYDFMGYEFSKKIDLSFHHLIVPHKNCKELGLGEGYFDWNCSILNKNSSHPYLHLIGDYDYDIFSAITNEMINENLQGYIDMSNLRKINDILNVFERDYGDIKNKKGYPIIKKEYTKRLLKNKR